MASVTVVPKSGCSMISNAISADTGISGINRARSDPRLDRREASTCAAHSSSASLANSDGWNPMPSLIPIQLREPLIFRPMPGTSTTTSRPREISRAAVDAPRMTRSGNREAMTNAGRPSAANRI